MTKITNPEEIVQLAAYVAYAAIKAYNEAMPTNVPFPIWEDTTESNRQEYISAARLVIEEGFDPNSLHTAWMQTKIKEGWKLGEVIHLGRKMHPNLIPFADLPAAEQLKDFLFCQICKSITVLNTLEGIKISGAALSGFKEEINDLAKTELTNAPVIHDENPIEGSALAALDEKEKTATGSIPLEGTRAASESNTEENMESHEINTDDLTESKHPVPESIDTVPLTPIESFPSEQVGDLPVSEVLPTGSAAIGKVEPPHYDPNRNEYLEVNPQVLQSPTRGVAVKEPRKEKAPRKNK